MSTPEEIKYKPLNTVQTVLSQKAVTALESMLHWKDSNFEDFELHLKLLAMLSEYVKSDMTFKPSYLHPPGMISCISQILEINTRLMDVQRYENPYEWIDTVGGYRVPIEKSDE